MVGGIYLPPCLFYMIVSDKINKEDIFAKLQTGEYAVICSVTKKLFSVVVSDMNPADPKETLIVFASPDGYRDCPIKNLYFVKNHRGDLCIEGMTSLNGWGSYNSPFTGVIYKPIKELSEIS